MGSRRHLTIGITVNLENYENLRLEMSAEVEGEKDTEELIASLDAILARLGRGTQETAELVDSYRRRVFTLPKETTPLDKTPEVTPPPVVVMSVSPSAEAPAPTPLPPLVTSPVSPADIPPPVTSPAPAAVPAPEKPPIPASPPVQPAVPTPSPKTPPSPVSLSPPRPGGSVRTLPPISRPEAPSQPPSQAPAPPSPSPRPPGELSCERCGTPITTVQRKLSRLFQNKDLCKKCLNQP